MNAGRLLVAHAHVANAVLALAQRLDDRVDAVPHDPETNGAPQAIKVSTRISAVLA
jgi:hypothetical protein